MVPISFASISTKTQAERTATLCHVLNANAWAHVTDVGSAQSMQSLADWVEDALGEWDIVVNNAGIGMAGGMLETSVADWEKLLKVNVLGRYSRLTLVRPSNAENARRGSIVNVASAAAFAPNKKLAAYSTKSCRAHAHRMFALNSATRILA